MLSINPSYQTQEVTYDSCPCHNAASISSNDSSCQNWGSSTPIPEKWAKNVPLYHGDSVLGIFGDTNFRFSKDPLECSKCPTHCNTMTALFYKPARQYVHPTYGFQYKGRDNYYRKPY